MPETLTLDSVSVLLVWTAIAVYALAFIAYAVDLSRRGADAVDAQDAELARDRELVAVGATGAADDSVARLRAEERAAEEALEARPSRRPRLVWARIGTSLTVLAFLFHLGGAVTRGIASGRVPWSNMYEFALTGTLLIVAVYLIVLLRYDLRFLGAFITGMVVLLLGASALKFYVEITPLMDPLKSVWLVIHVFVASLATALFSLAFGLSVLQLMQARRERKTIAAAELRALQDERGGDPDSGEDRPAVPADRPRIGGARVARLPVRDPRLHLLDLHADRRIDLGERRLGTLLGLRHEGSLDLRHLGALRRLHPRAGDARLARLAARRGCRSSASRR